MRIPFLNLEIRAAAKRPRPDAFDDFWYSRESKSTATGLDINEDSALKYSAVWACVRVIGETLGSLPLIIYRRTSTGKERATEHPCYGLLHDAPNPEMSAMQFREAMQGHLLLWGNAYAEIQRNLRGQVMALWPLNPAKMTVTRSDSNELVYEYRLEDGSKKLFDKESCLHVAGLGYNGLVGYSVISYMAEAIGLGLASEEFGARFFGNDASPRVAITHPGHLTESGQNNLRESWQKTYGGLGNAHRAAILEEGMKVERIGLPNVDAQFLETRKFQVTDIARIFRVPCHLIQDLERATFSNIEHQGIDFVTHTIRPWCVRWEQAIQMRLLGQGEYFAEHLVDGLLRGDIKSRYDAYAVGRNWGWLSANDIRRMENQNPLPADEGDIYLSPMNMVPADKVGQIPVEPSAALGIRMSDEEKEEAAKKLRLIGRS